MALKLNATREVYREFYDRNVGQMPKLIADGRVPMNVAQLMQRRLDVRNSDADVKGSYLDNYFDTGDAVAYHPDGRIKIVLDSQTLRGINPESKLINGALVLTEDDYNALQGEELKKEKFGKINESLLRKEVKSHPVWKILAREQALLDDYVDYIFAEGKQRFNYDTTMGIYLISAQGSTPDLRAWCVSRLGLRSDADGRNLFGDDYGRFLGVAPEALNAKTFGVQNVRKYTMDDLQSFDSAMKGLEVTIKSELLEPFARLRKKL